MGKKINRKHRRRLSMQLRNMSFGGKPKKVGDVKDPDGTRDHSRPRPNGKKIRVKRWGF